MRASEQPQRSEVVEILIADDHELFRRTLRGFIEAQSGWHVCGEAGDGLEAFDKAKVLRPDVVLMDINMPRMGGLEATRLIRRVLPECKVVIVTQNHASIARQQAASVDEDRFVEYRGNASGRRSSPSSMPASSGSIEPAARSDRRR